MTRYELWLRRIQFNDDGTEALEWQLVKAALINESVIDAEVLEERPIRTVRQSGRWSRLPGLLTVAWLVATAMTGVIGLWGGGQ